MTQKTKLEIIGEYREDHPGPFCTRDGRVIDLKIRDGRGTRPLLGYVADEETLTNWWSDGRYSQAGEISFDLMCAREVPVVREFWVNEYEGSNGTFRYTFDDEATARCHKADTFLRTIHVREVLPGEGE